jgi:DNA invertase Pin-like site-specific DNA recombinase
MNKLFPQTTNEIRRSGIHTTLETLDPSLSSYIKKKYGSIFSIAKPAVCSRAIGYARYSCEKRDEPKDKITKTIETQVSAIMAFSQDTLGVTMRENDVFWDAAISGATIEREEFHTLLRKVLSTPPGVKCPFFDAIVVFDSSRLMRDMRFFRDFVDECKLRGIRVWETISGHDLTDEKNSLTTAFSSALNELARIKGSQYTREQTYERGKQGYAVGSVPYGYRLREISKGRKIVEIDEEKAKTVVLIFEKYADGWSYAQIAEHLTKSCVPPPSASWRITTALHWKRHTIWFILRNESYRGILIFGKFRYRQNATRSFSSITNGTRCNRKGIKYGTHPDSWVYQKIPSIVKDDLWNAVQARLTARF